MSNHRIGLDSPTKEQIHEVINYLSDNEGAGFIDINLALKLRKYRVPQKKIRNDELQKALDTLEEVRKKFKILWDDAFDEEYPFSCTYIALRDLREILNIEEDNE